MIRTLIVLAALAVGAAAGDAWAQAGAGAEVDARIEAQTRQLAAELRCPVCQGVSIEDSPTELATQMKDVIRQQLRQGATPAGVRAYFVGRYGEWILLQPDARGFNLTIYLLPGLMLLIGAVVVGLSLRRWTRPPGSRAPQAPSDAAAPRRAEG